MAQASYVNSAIRAPVTGAEQNHPKSKLARLMPVSYRLGRQPPCPMPTIARATDLEGCSDHLKRYSKLCRPI